MSATCLARDHQGLGRYGKQGLARHLPSSPACRCRVHVLEQSRKRADSSTIQRHSSAVEGITQCEKITNPDQDDFEKSGLNRAPKRKSLACFPGQWPMLSNKAATTGCGPARHPGIDSIEEPGLGSRHPLLRAHHLLSFHQPGTRSLYIRMNITPSTFS